MNEPACDKEIVKTIISNLFEHSFCLSSHPRYESYQGNEVKWIDVGVPYLNRIFGATFSEENAGQQIAQIQRQFKTKQTPVTWIVDPFSEPPHLDTILEQQGWTFTEEWFGMSYELLDPPQSQPLPQGFLLQEVVDEEMLKRWSYVLATNSSLPEASRAAYQQVLSSVPVGNGSPWHPYAGFLHGELIATGVLFQETPEVAGVYLVATLPSARKRGIATAMMEHLLLESWKKRYRRVVLLANSMGYGVYQRLGFTQHCTLKIYVWQPL